jgi:hypothetical protein
MEFTQIVAGFWAFAIGGGALLIGLFYAFVLLHRRRASGRVEPSSRPLQPEGEARAAGRALRPQDIISCIAGIWLAVSPWILGYGELMWIVPSNVVFGIMIAIFALAAVYRVYPAEEWVIAAVAAWVFVSPWVLPGATLALAWSNWITAAIIVIAALSNLVMLSRPSGQPELRR